MTNKMTDNHSEIIRLAVIDVDGTIFLGNVGIEFLKNLIKKKLVSDEMGGKIFSWYGKYEKGKVDKSVAVDEIYKLFAMGMKGKKESEMKKIAKETWSEVSGGLYDFSEFMISFLKNKGFKVILVSGSPVEMVEMVGKHFNIDKKDVIAGRLEVKNGKYTGKIVSYPGSSKQKIVAINSYARKENLSVDFYHSFGMGNNERDRGVLDLVGFPFAFEPNAALRSAAKKGKFTIVNKSNICFYVRSKITDAACHS